MKLECTGENGIKLVQGEGAWLNEAPVRLSVREMDGGRTEYRCGYESVRETAEGFCCQGSVRTKNGSRFLFDDTFAIDCTNQEILVGRRVRVEQADGRDAGFSTSFSLAPEGSASLKDYDIFIPGIWYRGNEGAVKQAFGGDPYLKDYLIRVTRMALPYVQVCGKASRQYLAFCHTGEAPTTGVNERTADWLADETLQYCSMGVSLGERLELTYRYPGSEGEINYLEPARGWACRDHPVRLGVKHAYRFTVHLGEGEDAASCMRQEWRHWYSYFRPAVHKCDLERNYQIGVQVLDTYCQEYNGVMGIPFWAEVPEGHVCDISFQMGFVGQQLQCAYHLLRYGCEREKPGMVQKGRELVDFWVRESTRDSVVPRVWYEVFPPEFKKGYPTYLRTAADGMEGVFNCWQYLHRRGEEHPEWLAFCLAFADWLAAHQNADGSWYRAYDEEGEPVHRGKFNTSNPIRFLANLFWATGEEAYRRAALAAGEYCYGQMYLPLRYIGGTADNDNTIDKEAGMLALYAFLALYDLTGEEKWVRAAQGAADFCETWTYAWSYEVKPCKGNAVFGLRDQTGLSLIATGHSHCDVMMAYCPFDFYRLYLLTGDRHYYEFGEFLLHNTKQTTDWDGKLGHAYPGLLEESGELARQYHNGLGRWLPWCTIAQIEPLTRLKEWFGSMEPEEIEEQPLSWRLERNAASGSSFLR